MRFHKQFKSVMALFIVFHVHIFFAEKNMGKAYADSPGPQKTRESGEVLLDVLATSIPQRSQIDVNEWFSVSVSYAIKNFSRDYKYRLYMVGRNSMGMDLLFMGNKSLESGSGTVDLGIEITDDLLLGFGKYGDLARIFVKIDVSVAGDSVGTNAATRELVFIRGIDTPVKNILETPATNLPVTVGGVTMVLRRGEQVIWHANGSLKHGFLDSPVKFNADGKAITAGIGKASFFKNGRLQSCWNLAEDTVLRANGRELLFLKGESLDIYPDGSVSVGNIAADYTFKAGTRSYPFIKKSRVGFFHDGSLRIAVTAGRQDVMVGDKTFTLGPGSMIYFRSDGLVEYLVGAVNISVTAGTRNIACAPGTAITFTREGVFTGCRLADDVVFELSSGTFTAFAKSEISFHKNGIPEFAEMKQDTLFSIGKKKILLKAKGMGIRFYDNGTVYMSDLAAGINCDVTGGMVNLKADKQVAFTREGTLLWGHLEAEAALQTKYGPLAFEKNKMTHFHPNGNVKMAYLARDIQVNINGINYPLKGKAFISFHANGTVLRANLASAMQVNTLFKGRKTLVSMNPGNMITFTEDGTPTR